MAGTVQLTCNALSCNLSTSFNIRSSTSRRLGFCRAKIRAESQAVGVDQAEEPPSVAFAFVSSVLLPDGTPDVHFRKACGGQKLRNIMLDSNIDLYGPYARPLLNCAGGGTCGTCMVEIIQGEELLSPRTDKEKEKLTKKVVVQQLPEWKGHEWDYEKISPSEFQSELELEFGSESS
ncbi:photosynthetic NDH subunit of subcomplex B 3, chloroplastic isoform X2 [Alnus glutinosa]|uniref:photosynthetic NDH subunit of subcomplex B 3, chloroplastic isoform X2 n=1 Tax=Alnus glutinosa TaxID=3517 RepID=UPI002D799DBE|nr:photosynthetic NDH subunit of subcomplex B 3, chloroplastic isoform X2 [Alnus glutinosa]